MPELNAEQRSRLRAALVARGDVHAVVADILADAQREAAQAVLDAVEKRAEELAASPMYDRMAVCGLADAIYASRTAAARYGAGTAAGGDGR